MRSIAMHEQPDPVDHRKDQPVPTTPPDKRPPEEIDDPPPDQMPPPKTARPVRRIILH